MSKLSLFVVWQDQNGLNIVSIRLKLQHPYSGPGGLYHDNKSVALKVFVFLVQWMCGCACVSFIICLQLRILVDCAVCIWDQLLTMWWWRILFLKFLLSCHLYYWHKLWNSADNQQYTEMDIYCLSEGFTLQMCPYVNQKYVSLFLSFVFNLVSVKNPDSHVLLWMT